MFCFILFCYLFVVVVVVVVGLFADVCFQVCVVVVIVLVSFCLFVFFSFVCLFSFLEGSAVVFISMWAGAG